MQSERFCQQETEKIFRIFLEYGLKNAKTAYLRLFYLTDLSNKQARHAEHMILFKLIALDFFRLIFGVD